LAVVFFFVVLKQIAVAQLNYKVQYIFADSDTAILQEVQLQTDFDNRIVASDYIVKLLPSLRNKGFITASIDSVRIDSSEATVKIFLGQQYRWAHIITQHTDEDILQSIRWNSSSFSNNPMNFTTLQLWQQRILNYLEENGHPFAKVYLDSIDLSENEVKAILRINRGPLYKIDSIRVYGNAKVSNEFLQRYLEVPNGSLYNKKRIQSVAGRINQLSYLQEERPADVTLLGTGSVLNLYLMQKKSNQVNVLIGFLPNANQSSKKKFLITGEANIFLRNALGAGETIGLNWQQLQQQSPRLSILYEHPFIFHSPFGLNFSFDMFRQDTTFLNINFNFGTRYFVGETQSATVFLQRRQTIVNGINENLILQTRRLPQDADVSSLNLGTGYDFTNTDYRFNPRKGNEFAVTASAGRKKINRNNQVLDLKDPSDPEFNFEKLYDTVKLRTYQVRVNASGAHYIAVGKHSAVKTGLNAGFFESGNIFRNELFRIGGYRLLRGFDEESQYVSRYIIGSLEYRYLVGLNSNFFAFADGGWSKHPMQNANHSYLGTGIGMAFETKAGIFNLVWALGKRDDSELNLRQSKIHLGFVNYF
ncbi:MAG: hypothetical protein ICV66_01740, partial [Chitinophagaceae bacterium]|nr:hypothetical protein [Chitinophagaceae bacterium]